MCPDTPQDLLASLAEPYPVEALFDCLPDVVFFVKNLRCEYVALNQTLVERCGRQSKGDLIGRTADDVFPSALGQSYRAQDEEVLRSGIAIRNQLELHFYPTGRRGWCVTNKLPLRGRQGDVVGTYTTRWGASARMVLDGSPSTLTWSNTPVTAKMTTTTLTTGSAGQKVGTVTWTAGKATVSEDVVLDGAIRPPSAWWRLTHPFELGT